MVKAVRETEKAIGKANYEISEKVKKSKIFGRSLFAVKDIKKDETFTKENVRSIRPEHGLEPKYLKEIIGKTASKYIKRGLPMSWELINNIIDE